jgi:hypothetical protein
MSHCLIFNCFAKQFIISAQVIEKNLIQLGNLLAGEQRAGGKDAAPVVTALVSDLARPRVAQIVAAGVSNQKVLAQVVQSTVLVTATRQGNVPAGLEVCPFPAVARHAAQILGAVLVLKTPL